MEHRSSLKDASAVNTTPGFTDVSVGDATDATTTHNNTAAAAPTSSAGQQSAHHQPQCELRHQDQDQQQREYRGEQYVEKGTGSGGVRSLVPPASPGQDDARSPFADEAEGENSAEWDASKVPPSRFQKRKGSIYAVQSSRDGHVERNNADGFHEKHAELASAKKW